MNDFIMVGVLLYIAFGSANLTRTEPNENKLGVIVDCIFLPFTALVYFFLELDKEAQIDISKEKEADG